MTWTLRPGGRFEEGSGIISCFVRREYGTVLVRWWTDWLSLCSLYLRNRENVVAAEMLLLRDGKRGGLLCCC